MISVAITADDMAQFAQQGFLVKERCLDAEFLTRLQGRFAEIFGGRFDTGVYPDEWYWREEMSKPDVTRHMANAWKADLTIARLALSEELARAAAQLSGWNGCRLGQDTIWWKPPQTKSVSFHQDTSFMDFLDPSRTVTAWVALDDTHRDAGTLEYAPGSHRWPLTPIPEEFHAKDDYMAPLVAAARAAAVAVDSLPETVFVEAPAGSVSFHAGETWHGSAPNITADRMRRSIGLHYLPLEARFSSRRGGYIYRRYQLTGSTELNESFFPVVWREDGYRTEWMERFVTTGQR